MAENHDVAVYGGYIDNDFEVLQSASGGIATAMARYVIAASGSVAGVAYSKDFYRAEYILADSEAELQRLRGSKYIECEKNNIFSDVKKRLDDGKELLFFGLPCVVAALYKFLGTRPKNLLTCELVCHGPTSDKIHKQYITYLENTFRGKVIDFSVRHKKEAWLPAYLYAKFDNGKIFEKPFYDTEYGYAFSIFGREACYQCGFKGSHRQGDIMIGDFWGAIEKDPFWNPHGVSVIFAETEKGHRFLLSVPNIKLFPTTFEKAVQRNQMVILPKQKLPAREDFSKLFMEKGLFYAVEHSMPRKEKMKRFLSRWIPRKLKPITHSIYAAIKKSQ